MKTHTHTPTNSRTDCRWVQLGDIRLFFSYNTCIGVSYWPTNTRVRRRNCWGQTTGKHINMAGIRAWPEVGDEQEFEKIVASAFMHQGMEMFKREIGAEYAKAA